MRNGTDHDARGARLGLRTLPLAALLVAGGCATTPGTQLPERAQAQLAPPQADHVFTIAFDAAGCPVSATPSQANCPAGPDGSVPKDCVHVRRGQTVAFTSEPAREFFLQFSPFFKHGTIRSANGQILAKKVDPGGTQRKIFTFAILSDPPEACTPLDPQIIVE